jgi:hypothetical protein
MKFSGGAWQTVGWAGFSAGEADFISLAFHGGEPYVAFMDVAHGNEATVMKFSGQTWQTVGSTALSAGVASFLSLAADNGGVYIAYRDGANGNKATVMRYEDPVGSPCGCSPMGPALLVAIACLAMMGARRRQRPRA